MNEVFGHKWASQFGDEPTQAWILGCADLNYQQIAIGFRATLVRQDEWPPSLPEFRKLCLEGANNRDWERQCHKIAPQAPELLEDITAREDRVRIGMESMAKLRKDTGLPAYETKILEDQS